MAHGLPDWGQVPDVAGYILTEDLAELAARLGSICTFDRRGSVFFLDDFESGVNKWVLDGNGYDEYFQQAAAYAQSGAYCGKLVTNNRLGDYARIERYFPHPQLVKIGFEISFTLDSNVAEVWMGFYGYGRDEWKRPMVYLDVAQKKLYNDQGVLGYVEFASDVDLVKEPYCFHTAKLVADLTTGKYVRFILDDKEYDLSSYEYNADPELNGLYLYAFYKIVTNAAIAAVSYVDNAIITRDET